MTDRPIPAEGPIPTPPPYIIAGHCRVALEKRSPGPMQVSLGNVVESLRFLETLITDLREVVSRFDPNITITIGGPDREPK